MNVNAYNVSTASTLFDILPSNALRIESVRENVIEITLRVAMRSVGDEIHVAAVYCVFNRLHRAFCEQESVGFVLRFFRG